MTHLFQTIFEGNTVAMGARVGNLISRSRFTESLKNTVAIWLKIYVKATQDNIDLGQFGTFRPENGQRTSLQSSEYSRTWIY